MIQFTKSYKTSDGQVFGSIEDAQLHEIAAIFSCFNHELAPEIAPDIAKVILEKKAFLIDILTTTPNSKPKARSTNGGTKTRKKTVVTDADSSTTSTVNTTS